MLIKIEHLNKTKLLFEYVHKYHKQHNRLIFFLKHEKRLQNSHFLLEQHFQNRFHVPFLFLTSDFLTSFLYKNKRGKNLRTLIIKNIF